MTEAWRSVFGNVPDAMMATGPSGSISRCITLSILAPGLCDGNTVCRCKKDSDVVALTPIIADQTSSPRNGTNDHRQS
jgi:hypothetical protein